MPEPGSSHAPPPCRSPHPPAADRSRHLYGGVTWREVRQERLNHALIAVVRRNDTDAVRNLLHGGADLMHQFCPQISAQPIMDFADVYHDIQLVPMLKRAGAK